jgi:galactonate dehydratase
VKSRILGRDPFEVEAIAASMIRDQFQGGVTAMTAIGGVEMALWDIIGKSCGQPVYRLLGGRCHERIPAYASGWDGGAIEPHEFAQMAREAVERGYRALEFDPFGASVEDPSRNESEAAIANVAAVREAVGPAIELMIEFHGNLSTASARETILALEPLAPAWCEPPAVAEKLDLLAQLKRSVNAPIAAGKRFHTHVEFQRLTALAAADFVQINLPHCGGLLASKKLAALVAEQGLRVAVPCSVGPVALAACLHFNMCTPNFQIQEALAEFDVPWRNDLVRGCPPIQNGEFVLSEEPGLGLTLDDRAIAQHPYVANAVPTMLDREWLDQFNQDR